MEESPSGAETEYPCSECTGPCSGNGKRDGYEERHPPVFVLLDLAFEFFSSPFNHRFEQLGVEGDVIQQPVNGVEKEKCNRSDEGIQQNTINRFIK